MILYFYYYCGVGILALIAVNYLQTPEQAEKTASKMRKAEEDAERTLPIPALAAVYVLASATTILVWPYYFIRSMLGIDAP